MENREWKKGMEKYGSGVTVKYGLNVFFFLNPKKWVEKMGWTVKSTQDHGGVEWLSLMAIKNMSNSVQATKSAENCHVCFDMTV